MISEYWGFFRRETALLGFGLVLAFFSSFGQTFLVSLFVPSFLPEFGIGNAGFGALYSAATVASALLLPWAGGWLDRTRLDRFTGAVVVLMALSAALMALAPHLVVFFVALLGIRLAGQGLSSHTAGTAMARYYGPERGKALSISSLGYPAGEAVLPLLIAASIGWVGWRWSWGGIAAAALLFLPLTGILLRRSGVELDPRRMGEGAPESGGKGSSLDSEGNGAGPGEGEREGREGREGRKGPAGDWTRREVLTDPRFWFVLPAALLPPFWATGLILYQSSIAQEKGWTLTLMASAFVSFAVTRVVLSLAVGEAVDRLSARRLFPVTVLPMGAGMALLLLMDQGWVAHGFMGLLGATMGMSANVKSALWAELYGVRYLGGIKSMMASLMVLSTAGAPVLVGWALDRGPGLEAILVAGVATVFVGAGLALRVVFEGKDPS